MSDATTKRPAHEVILSKLHERVEEFKNADDVYGDDELRFQGAMEILLDMLREMVIPKKEREKVLTELAQLADLWEAESYVPNRPRELHDFLVKEVMHM